MKENRIQLTYRGKPVSVDTDTLPWEIRDPAQDNIVLEWRVLLAAKRNAIDTFEVFVEEEDVHAWAAAMPPALVTHELVRTLTQFFVESDVKLEPVKQDKETLERESFNAAYQKLAKEAKLSLGSEELFTLAVQKKIVNSIVLVDAGETQAEYVEGYQPSLPALFVASVAHSTREGTLYDWAWPKETPNPAGKIEYIYAGETTLPIAFVTMAAETPE